MVRARTPKPVPKKRHHTERFRTPFIVRWTIAKGAYIGFLTGLGWSSADIEKHMRDGTSAPTVRRQWKLWGLPLDMIRVSRSHTSVAVNLSFQDRAKLMRQAARRSLTPEEYVRRMIVCAVKDDMYDAIVDREFE